MKIEHFNASDLRVDEDGLVTVMTPDEYEPLAVTVWARMVPKVPSTAMLIREVLHLISARLIQDADQDLSPGECRDLEAFADAHRDLSAQLLKVLGFDERI